MFKKLSNFIVNHPWLTIISWVIITSTTIAITVGGVLGSTIFDRLTTDNPTVSSESQTAIDLLEEAKIKASTGDEKQSETIFILAQGYNINENSKNVSTFYKETFEYLDKQKITYASAYGIPQEALAGKPELQRFIADDSFMTTATVTGDSEQEAETTVHSTVEEINNIAADNNVDNIYVGSESLLVETIIGQAESDLSRGESIALPLALLVMVIVFGGLLAAGMPLIGAIVSIVSALGTLYGLSFIMPVDTSTLNVLTVIGLGLSIDYGLLMISRFRETLREYENNADEEMVKKSALLTIKTAGRTVIFSGVTVAVSTLTLLMFEPELLKTIGFAATSVVLLAVIASTTLLPAIFVLLGNKLIKPSFLQKIPGLGHLMRALGDVAPRTGFFSLTTSKVQKHPWIFGIASTVLLVFLTLPVANMNVSNSGVDKLPAGTVQGEVFNAIRNDYPALKAPDVTVVVENEDKVKLAEELESINSFVAGIDNVDIDTINIQEYETVGKASFNVKELDDTENAVNSIRNYNENKNLDNVYVTGETALDIDYVASMAETAPWVALIIMIVTALLLFLMTGSLWIPVKAVFLSVLSLGASLGVLTWGFQNGGLAEVLKFDPSRISGVDPLILVLTLTFGFGLAMDYEMFLVSRIKEKHAYGASTNLAVREGLQASGRIITSAALMIVIVFLGFALGEMLFVKMMGVALAFAVIIDATIVRMILLPAIFTIFGENIWWSPKWMTKVYNKIGVEH